MRGRQDAMSVVTGKFSVKTEGNGAMLDVTPHVEREVERSNLTSGIATVFVPGSTAGVTTIEYESGVIRDLQDAFDRLIPSGIPYAHDARWGDGNGFSHVRAALLGASLTIPFAAGKLLLGTWQQVILADFDNRPRTRNILVQMIGE